MTTKQTSDGVPAALAPSAPPDHGLTMSRIGWLLAAIAVPAAALASVLDLPDARAASSQDWPPFVLVGGLLLIGVVANGDGVFEAAGTRLARFFRSELGLFGAATIVVAAVTAVLNLDTSVAFLTPVLVHLARVRYRSPAPALYACLLLSNAASLLLPGSNLTNLIVLGQLHLSGSHFVARMAPAFAVSVLFTALVVAAFHRRELAGAHRVEDLPRAQSRCGALGVSAVIAATALVLLVRSPAPWVGGIGVAAIALRLVQRRERLPQVVEVLGPQLLLGLFASAVALGTLGRWWNGPSRLLGHLDSWGIATFAAVTSVVTNNLPAASLLASRVPPHPFSLLLGLNLGPNLFVTGSLSSLLWLKSARVAGCTPSIRHVTRLGIVAVPLSMAAALLVLAATGTR